MPSWELARLCVYALNWAFSVAVPAIIATKLYVRPAGAESRTCFLSWEGSSQVCRFGIAWSAVALIALTCIVLWHLAEYITTNLLPPAFEALCFILAALWWLVAAIAFVAIKPAPNPSRSAAAAIVTVRVFTWILTPISLASVVIARQSASADQKDDEQIFIETIPNLAHIRATTDFTFAV